jgi:hypothetical protein
LSNYGKTWRRKNKCSSKFHNCIIVTKITLKSVLDPILFIF